MEGEKIKIEGNEAQEKEPLDKRPVQWIIMMFLLFILVMWVFSYYAVKIDPSPQRTPSIEEVFVQNFEPNISASRDIANKEDYAKLVKPNDAVIKQTADKIVGIACEGSRVCHAKAIFYFVRDNFQYVSDPTAFEYVKSPKESLAVKGGDCDDAAVLLANLLEAVGIMTRFVFIPQHVYVEAWLPEAAERYKQRNGWVALDATCKNCNFGEIPAKNIQQPKTYVVPQR
jgi:hypothetical protein